MKQILIFSLISLFSSLALSANSIVLSAGQSIAISPDQTTSVKCEGNTTKIQYLCEGRALAVLANGVTTRNKVYDSLEECLTVANKANQSIN